MTQLPAIALCAVMFCLGAQAQPTASPKKAPIKVGAISSLAWFPEATAAVKAYFDTVNAAGGIQGRKLQLIVEDDKADPETAARSARKLVEHEQVVANVGSASAMECAVNGAYYQQHDIVSIQGTGVDPACFSSPNIAPVNTGPYASAAVALKFLSDIRKRSRICLISIAYAPPLKPAFQKIVADFEKRSGRKLAYTAYGLDPNEDPQVQIRAAIEAKCDGFVFPGIEPAVVAWVKAVRAMKVSGVDWVFLTPAYTQHVAETLKVEGEGIFAMSEFEPWSSRSGMLTDWRNVMIKGAVPLTSFSQGGYVASSVFVNVLRGIKGEITRESVTQAFQALSELKVPLMGTPFTFGHAQQHNPNHAALPMRLDAGKWVVAHFDYITY